MNLKEKYTKVWNNNRYREFSPGLLKVNVSFKELNLKHGDSIIDFGCGDGKSSMAFFHRGINPIGVDIAYNSLDEKNENKFIFLQSQIKDIGDKLKAQGGFSVNCFEHIPPKDINRSLEVVSNAVEKLFISVSFHEDTFGPKWIGEPLHLTVMPPEWWELKLGQYFKNIKMVDSNSWVCNN